MYGPIVHLVIYYEDCNLSGKETQWLKSLKN